MSTRDDIYICEICGQMAEVTKGAKPPMKCCNQNMNKLDENTTDAAVEKHIPVVEKIDGGFKVFVGEVEHPMTDEHWIEWIELIAGDKVYKQFFNPGQKPEAGFKTDATDVTARAYCNLHGLWKK